MFFRDFRYQVEPNDDIHQKGLHRATQQFQDNLTLLQLSTPDLAHQLRNFKLQEHIFAIDRQGQGLLIHSLSMQACWGPEAFAAQAPKFEQNLSPHCFLFTELSDSGASLLAWLAQQSAHSVLIYLPSLEHMYASLHTVDWTPVLRSKQLFFSLEAFTPEQVQQDIKQLTQMGLSVEQAIFVPWQQTETQRQAEAIWHFEQSLLLLPDIDPVLRLHRHKYRTQTEFVLQNTFIEQARQQPSTLAFPWTLFVIGQHEALIEYCVQALLQQTAQQQSSPLQTCQRFVILSIQSKNIDTPQYQQWRYELQQLGIEFEVLMAPQQTELIELFLDYLHQLPIETAWFCRFYQATTALSNQALRQAIELELRFKVQPSLGMKRTLGNARRASLIKQHIITRRTPWPRLDNKPLPVLFLGNGPSLNACIENIQQGQANGYLWVSCGTSLATLAAYGIQPHLHLELEDYSHAITKLEDDYLQKIVLLAPLGFHLASRRRFAAHTSFLSQGNPIDNLMPGVADDALRVQDAFPTVLNLALALALQMGAPDIWLAGFDLVFYSQQSSQQDSQHDTRQELQQHHAQGSIYDQQKKGHYQQVSGELIQVDTLGHGLAHTKREFSLSAAQAKKLIQTAKVPIYQLSQGIDLGAQVATQLQMQPYSFQKHLDIRECLLEFLHDTHCTQLQHVQIDWHKLPTQYAISEQIRPWLEPERWAWTAHNQALWLHLLQQAPASLISMKRQRTPAIYWAEPFLRNLAALRLRLGESLSHQQVQPLIEELLKELCLLEAAI